MITLLKSSKAFSYCKLGLNLLNGAKNLVKRYISDKLISVHYNRYSDVIFIISVCITAIIKTWSFISYPAKYTDFFSYFVIFFQKCAPVRYGVSMKNTPRFRAILGFNVDVQDHSTLNIHLRIT